MGHYSIRENWARGAWGRSSCVEAKRVRVSSQLCQYRVEYHVALRKSLKCNFSDVPLQGTQSEVASSPGTFSPVIHFTPLFSSGHCREACLHLHAHYGCLVRIQHCKGAL